MSANTTNTDLFAQISTVTLVAFGRQQRQSSMPEDDQIAALLIDCAQRTATVAWHTFTLLTCKPGTASVFPLRCRVSPRQVVNGVFPMPTGVAAEVPISLWARGWRVVSLIPDVWTIGVTMATCCCCWIIISIISNTKLMVFGSCSLNSVHKRQFCLSILC